MEENKMTNEVATTKKLTFNSQEIQTIKNTVAIGATEYEFQMFMHLAQTYGLDPFNKEIWFIKDKEGKPLIMTSRDGYLKVANEHHAEVHDGLVSDVVHENDIFEKTVDGINHKYTLKNRGKIVGAYALTYRKDRKYPTYFFAPFEEYCKPGSRAWQQNPSAMIVKCAEAGSLKRAYSISGLVTREEMTEEYDTAIVNHTLDNENIIPEIKEVEPAQDNNNDKMTEKQKLLITKNILNSHLLTEYEKLRLGKKLETATKADASEIISWWLGDKEKNIEGERAKREARGTDKKRAQAVEKVEGE